MQPTVSNPNRLGFSSVQATLPNGRCDRVRTLLLFQFGLEFGEFLHCNFLFLVQYLRDPFHLFNLQETSAPRTTCRD